MKLRYFLFISLMALEQFGFGQTYSSIVSDKEICSFLNSMTTVRRTKIKHFFKRKKIENKIISWDTANFIRDTLKNPYLMFDENYLFKESIMDTIFSKEDRKFLFQQFNGVQDSIWHQGFRRSKLVKKKQSKNLAETYKYGYFSFSIPLFSLDKNYAVIRREFDGGFLRGHFGYYVYRKDGKQRWKLVTIVNEMSS